MAKADSANGASATNGSGDLSRVNIVVPMPAFMRARFEEEAKAKDQSLGPYVRDVLARQYGIVLPATVRTKRSKYSTPEEKEAAQKAKAKERNDLIKNLLAQHRARLNGEAVTPAGGGEASSGSAATSGGEAASSDGAGAEQPAETATPA